MFAPSGVRISNSVSMSAARGTARRGAAVVQA